MSPALRGTTLNMPFGARNNLLSSRHFTISPTKDTVHQHLQLHARLLCSSKSESQLLVWLDRLTTVQPVCYRASKHYLITSTQQACSYPQYTVTNETEQGRFADCCHRKVEHHSHHGHWSWHDQWTACPPGRLEA